MNGVGVQADGNMDWRAVNRPARCPDDGTASALRGRDSPSGGGQRSARQAGDLSNPAESWSMRGAAAHAVEADNVPC